MPRSENPPLLGYCTVFDVSCNIDHTDRLSDQQVVEDAGRQFWRPLKEMPNEPVWSPQLEAVLIEGLQLYHELHRFDPLVRATRMSFPLRNCFISKHIDKETNKTRTPKQVASRIQRLRWTCRNEKVVNLIIGGQEDGAALQGEADSPVSSQDAGRDERQTSLSPKQSDCLPTQKITVYVRLTPLPYGSDGVIPTFNLIGNDISHPVVLNPAGLWPSPSMIMDTGERLASISNTTRLLSPWPLNRISHFVTRGSNGEQWDDVVDLRHVATPNHIDANWAYEFEIAGDSWPFICQAPEPRGNIITQTLGLATTGSSVVEGNVITVMYYLDTRYLAVPENHGNHHAMMLPPRQSSSNSLSWLH